MFHLLPVAVGWFFLFCFLKRNFFYTQPVPKKRVHVIYAKKRVFFHLFPYTIYAREKVHTVYTETKVRIVRLFPHSTDAFLHPSHWPLEEKTGLRGALEFCAAVAMDWVLSNVHFV